jgi:DNA-binding transcriptional LysR family regulator
MQPFIDMPKIRDGFQKARLEELRLLVEVAEAGSLSAAAKKLGVPKSTVGRAVRRIEDDLGVALVRRMTKGPVLTEPGRVLADMAAPHIAALRDAPAALGRTASEAYGLLRIATLSDVGALVLAPLLPSFLARHPRVRPEVTLGLPPVDLAREGFDVGIRVAMSASLPSSSLIAKKLGPVNIAFYASPQYAARRELPKRLHDIHDHDTIGFFPGDTNAFSITSPKGTTRLELRPRVSGNDFFFVREAILAGLGVGVLPWFVATHEVAAGRAVRVLPDHQMALGTLYVVYPQANPLPPKVRAFTSHLREHVPRILGHA